ncbi:hypothetical protein ABH935_006427 [Catenulispora sp. GAS73]
MSNRVGTGRHLFRESQMIRTLVAHGEQRHSKDGLYV